MAIADGEIGDSAVVMADAHPATTLDTTARTAAYDIVDLETRALPRPWSTELRSQTVNYVLNVTYTITRPPLPLPLPTASWS